MEDIFKKNLTLDEFGEFAKHFSTGDVCSVSVDKIPTFLTTSENLQQKTRLVILASGALIGMCLYIYRYDKKDEVIGTPINVDRYIINNNLELFQRPLPLLDHRITSESFVAIKENN